MKFAETKTTDVVGVGNALMDFLVEVDDDILVKAKLSKGVMHLLEAKEAQDLLSLIRHLPIKQVPGGAAANTIKTVSALGGETVLFAKVGEDDIGRAYTESIALHGVQTKISVAKNGTGQALTLITPDSERTFSVHLGAAITLTEIDLLPEEITKAKILHLEAFQLEGATKAVIEKAIKIAKKSKTLISLDLADVMLINRNQNYFTELVRNDIDILFCNENEAEAFTGKVGTEALKQMGELASIAVLKLGEKGSLVLSAKQIFEIKAVKTKAIDSTGAGDTYAAGFLYGLTQGWDIEKSANLGASVASLVVSQIGVDVMDLDLSGLTKVAIEPA
jgi:sugar/nucleoside kinase (ribokinase family)